MKVPSTLPSRKDKVLKTIGLIGGMSWESSLEYYRLINESVKRRLGGRHSADCLMYSFDFEDIEPLQSRGEWDEATRLMIQAARRLERGGASCVVICTGTMHKMADAVQEAVDIPLLHIADASAAAIQRQGIRRVGLLGTIYTMTQDFFIGRLRNKFGLDVIVPEDNAKQIINRIIYDELVLGEINPESRVHYVEIIEGLGAQGVILGCTEIGLLIKPEHSPIPVFDTTRLHAEAAVDFALS
jgi:aspartate racemase